MQGLFKFLCCIGVFCIYISNVANVSAQNCPNFDFVGNGTVTDVVCKGDSDGTISILVNNTGANFLAAFIEGTAPSGQMQTTTVGGATLYTDTFTNLSVGVYNVIVGDDSFCADTITVTVNEPSEAFTVVIDSFQNANCGSNGYLHAQASGGWSLPASYVWDGVDASNNPIPGFPRVLGPDLSAVEAGTYTVMITDQEGCTVSDMQTITGGLPFTVDLSISNGSLPLELGDSIDLVVTPSAPSSSIQYTWFPSTDLTFLSSVGDSVRVKPCQPTTYLVYAVDPIRLCDDLDSIQINLEGEFNPWLPNVFSPDSFNPNNNTFKVFGVGVETADMEIYDRKGALIYQNGPGELIGTWDGSLGDSGTTAVAGKYLYVLKIRSICGDIVTRSGGISLLR